MGSAQDYSPAEMLQFGQRAEADGDYDYALRAYAYLADQFPDSTEGRIAYESYARVEKRTKGGPAAFSPELADVPTGETGPVDNQLNTGPAPLTAPSNVSTSPSLDVSFSPKPAAAGSQKPNHGGPSPTQRRGVATPANVVMQSGGPPPASAARGGRVPDDPRLSSRLAGLQQDPSVHAHGMAPATKLPSTPPNIPVSDPDHDTQLPRMMRAIEEVDGDLETAFRRKYRAGGVIAICLVLIGWLALLGGAAAIAATYLNTIPELTASGSTLGMIGLEFGLAAMAGGVFLIFVGQLGQAIFDNANATRQLLAIERAKAGY
ncbi:MAG: hypothetical protein AAFR75_07805 [Pseudomonadota bacterium]